MATVLVGRERPLGVVHEAVDAGVAGRGGLVLVAGEAGIGKSSLLTAAAEHAAARGALVLAGGGWDGDGVPACWPWIQVTRGLQRGVAADEWARCEAAAGPGVARLLGDVADGPGDGGDDAGGFLVLDAVASLLVTASRARPVVVVLDDLHWADPATVRVLDFVARRAPLEAVVVLAAYRDAEVDAAAHPLRAAVHDLASTATTLRLAGLDQDGVRELVARELVTAGAVDDDTVAEMHRRTGGNPFFVQQTAQLWAVTGSSYAVPAGVRDAVERRLARLPSACVDALSTAALVGAVFEVAVVAGALGLDEHQAADVLAAAEAAGLVAAVDAGTRRFVHDLVRETLAAALSDAETAARHATILAVLDADVRDDAGRQPARLAHHAFLGVPVVAVADAARLLRAAARDAAARCAADEARVHLERALSLTDTGAEEWRPTALELAAAQLRGGRLADGRATYLAVANAARRTGDVEALARAAFGLHEVGAYVSDDITADIALLTEASAAVAADCEPAHAPLAARLLAAISRAQSHNLGADREESERLSAEAVEAARASGDDRALAFCLLARHDAIWKPGTAGERLALTDEMGRAGGRLRDPEVEMQASLLRLAALFELADPRAFDEQRRLAARAEEARLPRFRFFARSREATVATLAGDFEAARAHADAARALGDQIGDIDALGVWADQRWEIARLQDRPDELSRVVDEVRAGHDAHAAVLEATEALAHGDVSRALATKDELDRLGAGWPRWAALMFFTFRTELALAAGDLAECAAVRADFAPHADNWVVLGGAVTVRGPVRYWLAVLDEALGALDEAVESFDAARRDAQRLGVPPWAAMATAGLARALAARGGSGDAKRAAAMADEAEKLARPLGMAQVLSTVTVVRADLSHAAVADATDPAAAVFRRDGDVWTLTFAGATVLVPDAKGLRDLHELLAHPGTEVEAAVLLDPDATNGSRVGADLVLDDEAKAQYRRRLDQLDADIDSALARHADDAAVALETERDALVDELRRASGLGGRARRLGDTHERARKTVTARIRDVLRRLDERHPALADHLRTRVSTGAVCRYDPDPAVAWKL